MKRLIASFIFITFHFLYAQHTKLLIPYREGNKWGYCDTLGKVKIKPQFSSCDFFIVNKDESNNHIYACAIAKKDSNFILIDTLGKVIIPIGYKKIVAIPPYKKDIYFEVYDYKNKVGLYKNKRLIITPTFDEVRYTSNNNFLVKNNNKWGLIKDNGEIIIPIQYDYVSRSTKYSDSKNYVWLAKKGNEKTKFSDKRIAENDERFSVDNDQDELGELIKAKDEMKKKKAAGLVKDEISGTNFETNNPLIKNTITLKKRIDSIINLIPFLKTKYQLDSILSLSNDRYFYYVEKEKQQGFIDDSLQLFLLTKPYNIKHIVLNNPMSWLYKEMQSLVLFLYLENGKFGLTNEFEDEILKAEYDDLQAMYNNSYVKTFKNNKVGYFLINSFYKPIKPKYENINLIRKMKVNDTGYFSIFEVTGANGVTGYIGENGIEYFKN